jgi:hypothetical protein
MFVPNFSMLARTLLIERNKSSLVKLQMFISFLATTNGPLVTVLEPLKATKRSNHNKIFLTILKATNNHRQPCLDHAFLSSRLAFFFLPCHSVGRRVHMIH